MSDPHENLSMTDTVELLGPVTFADSFFAADAPRLEIEFGGATDRGKVRARNEDQFAIIRRKRTTEILASSIDFPVLPILDDVNYGLVVADGIGGSKAGDVASRLAIQTMLELSGQATSWLMKLENPTSQQIQQRAEAYVQRIQETLLHFSQSQPDLEGMGTTWTSAHLLPSRAVIVHLGDSRAYLLRDGQLHQITRDETLEQAWIDSGADPQGAKQFRHVLLNSLGSDREGATPQIHIIEFGPGDRLMLCTDGLYGRVSAEDIRQTLLQDVAPQAICDHLIQQALDAGGSDNITVALAVAKEPVASSI